MTTLQIPPQMLASMERFESEKLRAAAPAEPTYTAAEVEVMIGLRLREMEARLISMVECKLRDTPSINRVAALCEHAIAGLQQQIKDLRDQMTPELPDLSAMFPQPERITKMKMQIFHNTGRGAVARKLKLYVWTCKSSEIDKYLRGTCGDFYMNMSNPHHRDYRRFTGDSLDYLNPGEGKLVGALSLAKFDKRKFFDQAAIVMPDNHLYIWLYGTKLDCGMMRSSPDDWQPKAAKGIWQYPDCYG